MTTILLSISLMLNLALAWSIISFTKQVINDDKEFKEIKEHAQNNFDIAMSMKLEEINKLLQSHDQEISALIFKDEGKKNPNTIREEKQNKRSVRVEASKKKSKVGRPKKTSNRRTECSIKRKRAIL